MQNSIEIMESKTQNTLEGFVLNQFEVTKALYTSGLFAQEKLTSSAKLFLWALCTHYNPKKNTMFPSQATVARNLGISEKSAERAVKELKEKGLVDYETKHVNHYQFSAKFFGMLKMSGSLRQNVGVGVRQNVGLTNKPEQRKNKKDFSFKKELPSGGRAVPSVEETRKLFEEREKIREEGFNPLEYSFEEGRKWINSVPEFYLRRSKIARFLVKKYRYKEFLYTLDFPIKEFDEV